MLKVGPWLCWEELMSAYWARVVVFEPGGNACGAGAVVTRKAYCYFDGSSLTGKRTVFFKAYDTAFFLVVYVLYVVFHSKKLIQEFLGHV